MLYYYQRLLGTKYDDRLFEIINHNQNYSHQYNKGHLNLYNDAFQECCRQH